VLGGVVATRYDFFFWAGLVLTFCINSTRGGGGHESPRWIFFVDAGLERLVLVLTFCIDLFGDEKETKNSCNGLQRFFNTPKDIPHFPGEIRVGFPT